MIKKLLMAWLRPCIAEEVRRVLAELQAAPPSHGKEPPSHWKADEDTRKSDNHLRHPRHTRR